MIDYIATKNKCFFTNKWNGLLFLKQIYCNFMRSLELQDLDQLFGMDQPLVEDLHPNSTSENSQERSMLFQQFISDIPLDCKVFGFVSQPEQNAQEYSCQDSIQPIREVTREETGSKKMDRARQKNSNAIKKFGRVIMENIQEYRLKGSQNEGVTKMLQMLNDYEKGQKKTKAIDTFNISHLKALFATDDPFISPHNRRVTLKLFSQKMRKLVLESCQIKNQRKLIYLKAFKCCSLRLPIRNIAHRLSASQK